ncbi:MAG: sigma-70 family RNA polymerase sigma factor [Ruminococcus sp.]|nr:sigma-70 family RNA polymerase sigma factor [Ruminococcus sp.]
MKNRNKIIEENLGLVHSCCKRFKGKGVEYDDLYMAGCLGLVKAVDNFDDSRGFRLSTYAVPVILGEIKRLFRDGGTVKVSRSIKELYLKIVKLTESDNSMTITAIAEKLGVDEEKVSEALNAGRVPVSLTGEDNAELDLTVNSCEEEFTERLSLENALKELNPMENKLITLRYYQHKTQSQTGKILNMTQVQVCRKEKQILKLIRQKMLC